jgi:hypothetical protein
MNSFSAGARNGRLAMRSASVVCAYCLPKAAQNARRQRTRGKARSAPRAPQHEHRALRVVHARRRQHVRPVQRRRHQRGCLRSERRQRSVHVAPPQLGTLHKELDHHEAAVVVHAEHLWRASRGQVLQRTRRRSKRRANAPS